MPLLRSSCTAPFKMRDKIIPGTPQPHHVQGSRNTTYTTTHLTNSTGPEHRGAFHTNICITYLKTPTLNIKISEQKLIFYTLSLGCDSESCSESALRSTRSYVGPCHHEMARPRVEHKGGGLQI